MILCDIGNSYFKFYHNGKMWKEPLKRPSVADSSRQLVFISVNEKGTKKLKFYRPDAINLHPYLKLDTVYEGLGADRIAACMAIDEGVIVDAGSAITVDIMQKSIHLGGFILPGLTAYRNSFSSISKVLDKDLAPNISLYELPQNTTNAMSFGVIKSIVLLLQDAIKNKNCYFTGGDGKFFSKFFDNSIYDETLVFKGMQRAIDTL